MPDEGGAVTIHRCVECGALFSYEGVPLSPAEALAYVLAGHVVHDCLLCSVYGMRGDCCREPYEPSDGGEGA